MVNGYRWQYVPGANVGIAANKEPVTVKPWKPATAPAADQCAGKHNKSSYGSNPSSAEPSDASPWQLSAGPNLAPGFAPELFIPTGGAYGVVTLYGLAPIKNAWRLVRKSCHEMRKHVASFKCMQMTS